MDMGYTNEQFIHNRSILIDEADRFLDENPCTAIKIALKLEHVSEHDAVMLKIFTSNKCHRCG